MKRPIQSGVRSVAVAAPRGIIPGAQLGWLIRLGVLLALLLLFSAVLAQASFAGSEPVASTTSRMFSAVQVKVENLVARSQRFVNDLRSLHGIQRLAEQGPVVTEAARATTAEAASSSGPTACE